MSEKMDKLVAEAKEVGVKGVHLFKDPAKLKAAIEKRTSEEPKQEDLSPAVFENPALEPKAEDQEATVFYWKNNQNLALICGRIKIGANLEDPGRLYKSKKSVMRLDPAVDGEAIKQLRAHKDNVANGGLLFSEIKQGETIESSMGDRLDDLMKLEQPALAELVGGGPVNHRKTSSQLIAELIQK